MCWGVNVGWLLSRLTKNDDEKKRKEKELIKIWISKWFVNDMKYTKEQKVFFVILGNFKHLFWVLSNLADDTKNGIVKKGKKLWWGQKGEKRGLSVVWYEIRKKRRGKDYKGKGRMVGIKWIWDFVQREDGEKEKEKEWG